MDTPSTPFPAPRTRPQRGLAPWLMHLAAVLCYLGAAWTASREAITLQPEGWAATLINFPIYALGIGLAGLLWLGAGMRDKAWAHLFAAIVLTAPRIYTLPSDMFGAAPAIVLNLAAGIYLHLALWRDRALLRDNGVISRWLVLAVGLVLFHVAATQAYAALRAGYLALGQ